MVCHCFHISFSLRGMWFRRMGRWRVWRTRRLENSIVHRPLGQSVCPEDCKGCFQCETDGRRSFFFFFFTKCRTTNAPRSVKAHTVGKPRVSSLWRQMVGWASELPEHSGIETLGRVTLCWDLGEMEHPCWQIVLFKHCRHEAQCFRNLIR